jgi:hypothetical protein
MAVTLVVVSRPTMSYWLPQLRIARRFVVEEGVVRAGNDAFRDGFFLNLEDCHLVVEVFLFDVLIGYLGRGRQIRCR